MKHSSHQIRGKCTYHFALEPGITFHHGRETTVSSQHHMAGRFCLSLAAGRGGGAGVTARHEREAQCGQARERMLI